RIRFKNGMGGTAIPLLLTDPAGLTNGADLGDTLNISDRSAIGDDAGLLTSTSLTGLDMPTPNTIQQLSIDATSGQFSLTYFYPVRPTGLVGTPDANGSLSAGYHFYVVTGVTALGEESLPYSEVVVGTPE